MAEAAQTAKAYGSSMSNKKSGLTKPSPSASDAEWERYFRRHFRESAKSFNDRTPRKTQRMHFVVEELLRDYGGGGDDLLKDYGDDERYAWKVCVWAGRFDNADDAIDFCRSSGTAGSKGWRVVKVVEDESRYTTHHSKHVPEKAVNGRSNT